MVSIIIPARNEQFLQKTILDLLEKGTDVEVIAILDGYWPPKEEIVDDPRVVYLHRGAAKGMRDGINSAAAIARGEYLMKSDAHCMFSENYDKVLAADCDDNWIVISPRYSLDAENWAIEKNRKPRRDYHYLCFPDPNKADGGMHGVEWWGRSKLRLDDPQYTIDDTPSFQGSHWFMKKDYFLNGLGGMSETGYGSFSQEAQEIGLKTWLSGGRVVVNKKTWYAHLHKGKRYGRMYSMAGINANEGKIWATDHWINDREPGMKHKFEWFVEEMFPDMPTWPENWKEILYDAGLLHTKP